MRADAQRNRRELLRAARSLFIERGTDVPLDAIAQRAGVSIATLYRNFPDRRALVRAVVMDGMQAMHEAARQAHRRLPADPYTAWRDFARDMAELRAGALMPILLPMLPDLESDTELSQARMSGVHAVDDLIAAAQRHGQIRSDVAPAEVMLLIMAIARPLPTLADEHVPGFIERGLHVTLAGLRPGDDEPLPGHPVGPLREPSSRPWRASSSDEQEPPG